MYEEVCLLCGGPLSVEGRAYCSDECESLDANSPSISTTSSAYPSPYLHSNNGPGSLADVPALVASTMGRSLTATSPYKTHKNRHSISSSSASSAVCSVFADEDEEDFANPNLTIGSEGEFSLSREMLSVDSMPKASSFSQYYHLRGSGLSYARRPSGTNNRSTITTLNRRVSSINNSSPAEAGSVWSAPTPYDTYSDDYSDDPSVSPSPASSTRPQHGRTPSDALNRTSSEQDADPDTVTEKRRRNRASLPAYFSLLTTATSSQASPRSHRVPSQLQTLTTFTRSLQSSPPTPRVANPVVNPITAYSYDHSKAQLVETTPRGRGRQRDPEMRSTSSRRSAARSPPRQSARPRDSPPPCLHHHAHVGPQSRARLDSIEKVSGWVASSPVVTRGRTLTRRNSSPPAKPRFGMMAGAGSQDDLDAVREVLARSLHIHREAPGEDDHSHLGRRESDLSRGRRRVDELDEPPVGVDSRIAPGFGNGRSGLRARERERGRPLAR
ncbi:predicted protein [Postia placenta Mad-698-R]|nr:predicted protein [Postia placenta Mad-698-R]